MQELTALAGIAAALALGAASPGPSFVMGARTAAASSRAQGVAAALGMGLGGLVFALAALAGLQALLLALPSLYLALKLAGGLYLAYLGIRIWRGAGQTRLDLAPEPGRVRASRPFLLGLVTQLSNPKTAIVKQLGDLIARGGRRAVVEDSDWRAMLAMKAFRAKHGRPPGLHVVLAGDDPASAVYVRNKAKAAGEAHVGILIVALEERQDRARRRPGAVRGQRFDDRDAHPRREVQGAERHLEQEVAAIPQRGGNFADRRPW